MRKSRRTVVNMQVNMKASILFATLVSALGFSSTDAAPVEPLTPLTPLPPPSQPRCQVSMNTTEIDFGTVTRGSLEKIERGTYTFGKRSLALNISCQVAQEIRFLLQGNVNSVGGMNFGNNDHIEMSLVGLQLDGRNAQLSVYRAGADTHKPISGLLKVGDEYLISDGNRPLQGRSVTMQLEVRPVIAERNTHVTAPTRNQTKVSFILQGQ